MNTELIMLGTGNAAATKCYNACFAIKNDKQYFLIDAGGGNGILGQLEKAGIAYNDIHNLFITHTHTDHILGAVWIIRMIAQEMRKGKYTGELNVYGHDEVLNALRWMCTNLLPGKIAERIGNGVNLIELKDGDKFNAAGMEVTCFDIQSKKCKQFGCKVDLPEDKIFVCLGDEPYNEVNKDVVAGADWLMHEAFCLYEDREEFKPYEKSHSTPIEAGIVAQELGVKNLILFHTEDETLSTRKKKYTAEASANFSGNVLVPDDLEGVVL